MKGAGKQKARSGTTAAACEGSQGGAHANPPRNNPPPSADSPAHPHLASEAGPADGGQAPESGAGNLSAGYPPAFGQILVLGLGEVRSGGGKLPPPEKWPARCGRPLDGQSSFGSITVMQGVPSSAGPHTAFKVTRSGSRSLFRT